MAPCALRSRNCTVPHSVYIGLLSEKNTYRTCGVLPECGMGFVRSHIKQRLGLAKRTGYIVTSLIGIAMVDFWQFRWVADQQQGRSDSHDGPYLTHLW
jgi:hypothetical protein